MRCPLRAIRGSSDATPSTITGRMSIEAGPPPRAGGPAEVIAELATVDGVRGVIIGAKGADAAALGSNSDRPVHICPKPVIVSRRRG